MTATSPLHSGITRGPFPGNPNQPDPSGPRSNGHQRSVFIQTGLVIGAVSLSLLIGIAGVPGTTDSEAGNGSSELQRGWAEEWTRAVEVSGTTLPEQATPEQRTQGLGLDLDAQKR